MRSFEVRLSNHLANHVVGSVLCEVVGLRLVACVLLDKDYCKNTVTLCPRDYVESYNWHVAEWVPFDAKYTIHRERPDSDPANAAEFVRPCYQHDPIDNGTRVSECRNCRQRMEFRNWEWSVT